MAPPVPESLSGLSSASLSDNPGLTSGNNTPQTSHTDVFPEARVTTPGTEDQSDVSSVDARLVADAGVDELEDEDEDVDPILHHIAHVQLEQPGSAQFRARPAPPTTFIEGVGPRLTKAAALRQGLEWDDPRDTRRALGSEVPVDFDNVPGHKRSGLALNVASLAEPSVAPRQNRAALLRMGVAVDEPVRNVAETAARNRARDLAEREQRRKSIALPQSLSNPDVHPRQNRAALLRLGQVPAPKGRNPRDVAEQAIINKEKEAAERLAKRKSVALPASLAAPAITPRANRASMLRTGDLQVTPRPSTMFTFSSGPSSRSQSGASTPAPRATADRSGAADKDGSKLSRRSSMAPLRSLAAPVIAPRANRASKLREKAPPSATSSRRSSTSSLTSMSTGTHKLNPSPTKPKYPMPSPKSRFTAPRPAPIPPRHKPTPSVSSEVSAAVEAVSAGSSPNPPERRNSIFRRLNPRSSSGSSSSEPRPTRSSILREGLGAKIGKARG